MSATEPFGQLSGSLQVWVAPRPTAAPAVNVVPSGSWYLFGATDGGQKLKHGGKLKFWRDDDHQGPSLTRRPEEDVTLTFTLVNAVLENYARMLHNVANLVSVAGPPATRTMYLKRGAVPSEYSIFLRGTVLSPYGAFPGGYYIPRMVFDGEPEAAYAKDNRVGLECQLVALEDDTYPDAQKLGWLVVQTS